MRPVGVAGDIKWGIEQPTEPRASGKEGHFDRRHGLALFAKDALDCVQASVDIVTKLRDQLVKLVKSGKGPQDLIDAKAVQEFQGHLADDPDQFLFTAYRGIWAHARELGGVL
jgi:hypothetical protein